MTMSALLRPALAVVLGGMLLGGLAFAAPPDGSLEDRMGRIERLLESQSLVDLLLRVDRLQNEVQRLQGQLEVQDHNMGEVQQHQKELFNELDRRLRRLEDAVRAGAASEGPPPREAPPAELPPRERTEAPPVEPAPSEGGPQGQGQELDEKGAYEQALGLLQERRYDEAAGALREFLDQYPDSRYAANAWYWLGEAQYVQHRLPDALAAFGKLADAYGKSPKVPDALLKIGFIYDEQGQRDKARETLSELIARYPRSSAAYLAQKRLQEISRAGNR
jgi:tol-pal system protein YbgF